MIASAPAEGVRNGKDCSDVEGQGHSIIEGTGHGGIWSKVSRGARQCLVVLKRKKLYLIEMHIFGWQFCQGNSIIIYIQNGSEMYEILWEDISITQTTRYKMNEDDEKD